MSETLIGVYQNLNGRPQSVGSLIGALSPELGAMVPAGLQVALRNAAFAYTKDNAGSNLLMTAEISGGLNLAELPVVGAAFSQTQPLRFDVQLCAMKAPWSAAQLDRINAQIASPALPIPATAAGVKGVQTTCTLTLGDTVVTLELPFDSSGRAQPPSGPAVGTRLTDGASINWYPLQRSLGPLAIQQAGLGYASGELSIYLDAQVSVAGLTITLDALSFSTPLQSLQPSLGLAGLGLQYDGGGVALGAALLKAGDGVYAGTASIDTAAFSLSAIGAYAHDANGDPSLVVYASVSGLEAGPPCLTITGLAACFGYNRGLVLPALADLPAFPLVSAAQRGASALTHAADAMRSPNGGGLAAALSALDADFPPTEGANFAGFGVQFSSFEMIQGALMLTVTFGQTLNVDLLGVATASFPPPVDDPVPPLAYIELALLASWQPASGCVALQSQITAASYVIAKSCKLTGGFDAALWYGASPQAGDFVFSAGGYHPSFKPPAHYPAPPRVGLRWQVSDALLVSGQAYFAFCPHALMAGAGVQAVWATSELEADFQMAFDLLIGWQPFSYRADLDERLSIHYHGTIFGIQASLSLELGASLAVWGPDFTGVAHVDVEGIGFTLAFGDAPRDAPTPLTWSQFRGAFLPSHGSGWSQAVTAGATPSSAERDDADLGIVNARELAITVRSAVPLACLAPSGAAPVAGPAVGIAPMGKALGTAAATATLTVSNHHGDDVTAKFAVAALHQNLPSALWGESLVPAPDDPLLIDALVGCTLTAAEAPTPGAVLVIAVDALQASVVSRPPAFGWQGVSIPAVSEADDAQRRETLAAAITAAAPTQRALLAMLGVPVTPDCAATIAEAFTVAPQLMAAA